MREQTNHVSPFRCHVLPPLHFGARGFENLPLARRQALNAMGGNLIEDRINLAADEFLRREVIHGFATRARPASDLDGGRLDQLAFAMARLERMPAQPVPGQSPPDVGYAH